MEIRESSGSFFRRPWNCFLLPHPGRRGEHKKVQRWGKRPSVQFISNQQVVTLLFSSSSSPPAGYGGKGKGAVSKFLLKDLPRFQVDQKPNRGNKITHQYSMKFVNELHVVAQCTTCRSDVSIASNIFWRTRKTRRQKRVPCCPPPRLNLAQIWGFLLARRS